MPAPASTSTTATISEARSPNLALSPDVVPQCLLEPHRLAMRAQPRQRHRRAHPLILHVWNIAVLSLYAAPAWRWPKSRRRLAVGLPNLNGPHDHAENIGCHHVIGDQPLPQGPVRDRFLLVLRPTSRCARTRDALTRRGVWTAARARRWRAARPAAPPPPAASPAPRTAPG